MQTYLTLSDVLAQDKSEPIWAINNAEELREGGGDVNIQVVVNGVSQRIVIPRTWIPINLTDRIPRKYLEDSMNFSSAVGSRLIRIISNEHANALRRDADYADELARVGKYLNAQRNAIEGTAKIKSNVMVTSAESDAGMVETNVRDGASPLPRGAVSKPQTRVTADSLDINSFLGEGDTAEVQDAKVSDQFIAWIVHLNNLGDKIKASNEIRRRSRVSRDELDYLIENISYEELRERMLSYRSNLSA